MKKQLLLLVALLCSYNFFAQTCLTNGITFSTQTQVDNFATDYPGCTNIIGDVLIHTDGISDPINNLNGLGQITRISGNFHIDDNNELVTLAGLDDLSFIGGYFQIGNSTLTSLESLNSLDSIGGYLFIDYTNDLSSLAGLNNLNFLGESLIIEGVFMDNLTGLEGLTRIGGDLAIDLSSLNDLNGLNNVTEIGGSLFFNNIDLNSFQGLNNLESIAGNVQLFSVNNLTNFTGLNNLSSIGNGFEIVSTSITSFQGLENLFSLTGEFMIHMNDNLITLDGLDNLDFSEIVYLEITLNHSLEVCTKPVICHYLFAVGDATIHENGAGCFNTDIVSEACFIGNSSAIYYPSFYDLNQNKIQDVGEPFYADIAITIDPVQTFVYSVSENNTNTVYLQNGNYTISYDEINMPNWQLTTDSSSYFVSLTDTNTRDTISFGIFPSVEHSEMIVTLASPPTRCDQFITFDVYTKNIGTTVAEGTLWFAVDPEIQEVMYIDVPDSIGTDLYGWHFEELYPGQSITKMIQLKIPGPMDFMLGDSLHFGSYTDFMTIQGTHTSRYFNYDPIVRCSYDPNDKLVNPQREDNYTLFEEDLFYTIRFQNTGNDVAYDVVILDTLDENLDPTSFRVLSTSHPDVLKTSLDENRYLEFEFRNIFLPDSTSNLDGSQGYVNYMISPKSGLAEETKIENTASIYFDTNPPVVTNTTENVMVSELPMIIATHDLGGRTIALSIFPNPSSGAVQIFSKDLKDVEIELLDIAGKILLRQKFTIQENLDLQAYPSGVYFINFKKEGHVFTEKLLKY